MYLERKQKEGQCTANLKEKEDKIRHNNLQNIISI